MNRIASLASVAAMALAGCAAVAQDVEDAAPPPPPFQGVELGAGPWSYDSAQADFKVEIVNRELVRPWAMAFLPEGGMLITERPGRLRHMHADGSLDPTPIAGLPDIYALGIAGLSDIELHPDFANNRLVYLSYSKVDPNDPMNSTLAVMRARWDGGSQLEGAEDIFVAQAWYGAQPMPEKCCGQGPAFGSYGGRIAFDADGYLFVTSGDRNYGEMVANPANHFGKIMRLNDDGSVPADNPWAHHLGHAPETWSTGHRNPTGLSIDPVTGIIWSTEFGPRGGDELNRIERAGDYGWMRVTQGFHYDGTPAQAVLNVAGVTDAVRAYGPPSLNPGNLEVYRGSLFPQWDGDLFVTSFTQGLLRYDLGEDGNPVGEAEHLLQDIGQRWRDVHAGPDGALYVLSDQEEGALLRISPAN